MNKRISILVALLMLALTPVMGLAEGAMETTDTDGIGNSGTIHTDLNADMLGTVVLNAQNVDVEVKVAEDAPYAELDATVIGINSADVAYDMTVTEQGDGITIDTHHTGTDIGINRVKVNLYVPADAIEMLTLRLVDSDLVINGVNVGTIDGNAQGGKIETRDSHVDVLDVETTSTKLGIVGELGETKLMLTGGEATINSAIVPTKITITGNDADVVLRVPDTAEGFVVNYDVTAGELVTDYATAFSEQSGSVTVGAGEAAFDITLNGGNLHVTKR